MKEKTIKHIAYQLKQNKENKQPGAIVLIGAGCSVSAGIPAASGIVDYILETYKENPDIKCLDKKPFYADLMKCLRPPERKKIFKHYVEKAKINVSHIYLSHLLKTDYVDYILTVNFDDLAKRALALYNTFPPIYDISIFKDLTTTTLDTKSITYLHGQYNGLWQLNTEEEMGKESHGDVVDSILNKITNNRMWIVVGYGGEDFIFNHLVKLGRFDNGLYWVGYKDNDPPKNVQDNLLNTPNKESFWIKGCDADSFFLKLNAELKNGDPVIFDKPFSFLSELQECITDIEDSDDYKSVKERFIANKAMIRDAVNKYENVKDSEPQMTEEDIKKSQLKKALIDCLINEKYEDLAALENQTKDKADKDLMYIVSSIYNNWGVDLGDLAKTKSGEDADKLFSEAFEKYSKAIEIKPDFHKAYYNWGTYLGNLTQTKSSEDADKLYAQAFEKYSKAIEIKPDYHKAYNNWGLYLGNLAKTKSGAEADKFYAQAFEKYSKAIEIKPDYNDAYNNWGTYLGNLAKTKSGAEADKLYAQAIEKFSKAIEIKPDFNEAYNNWGTYLGDLAKTKSGKDAEKLYAQAFEKLEKAVELGASCYNLACLHAIKKNADEAFRLLDICLQKNEIKFDFVEKDSDWDELREDPRYTNLKKMFLK